MKTIRVLNSYFNYYGDGVSPWVFWTFVFLWIFSGYICLYFGGYFKPIPNRYEGKIQGLAEAARLTTISFAPLFIGPFCILLFFVRDEKEENAMKTEL